MAAVPGGITFGRKVLLAPGYASAFTHSGGVVNTLDGQSGRYPWVKRGETIAEFRINGSHGEDFLSRMFSSKDYVATIRSPASGLVLHTALSHKLNENVATWNSNPAQYDVGFAMLLPDDEPRPESGRYMFADMCRLARDMRHYYMKPSRYWSMQGLSPAFFDKLLSDQEAANPRICDAMPHWSDYFDEARTNRPDLRPLIKHLR